MCVFVAAGGVEGKDPSQEKDEAPHRQQHIDSQLGGTHPQHLLRLLSTLHSHLLAYCTHHQFEEVSVSD